TEYLQRMLPAADDPLRDRAAQEAAVATHDMRARDRKRQEADEAERRQIGFAVDQRRKRPLQQGRKSVIRAMNCPRHADDADRNRVAACKLAEPGAVDRHASTA